MAHRSSPGYSVPTTLHLVGPGSWTEVPAVLSYAASDPFAVRIGFGEPGEPVDDGITWLLARELLAAGLERPAGEGDVRLWPARTRAIRSASPGSPSGRRAGRVTAPMVTRHVRQAH